MKKGKIFYRFCIYCMNRIKIFHELLEPTDSYFTKMITFYYEASNENFILPNTGSWIIFCWITHSYTYTRNNKRRKELCWISFWYWSKPRCCVRGRIAILIRYTLNTPSVQYWRSYKDEISVVFYLLIPSFTESIPLFDCTRICGAQHVWKHGRTFFCGYFYQYSILGHS